MKPKHDFKDYHIGSIVRLEYGAMPYGIISHINYDNGMCVVKFADSKRVYRFTSLEVIKL